MNIFKGLLFLEGYLTPSALTEEDFGPSYGNKIASQRSFGDSFGGPESAHPPVAVDACSAAGCG